MNRQNKAAMNDQSQDQLRDQVRGHATEVPDGGALMAGTPAPTSILLANLGTPQAPKAAALRPFLKEFLSDRRVVEAPRFLWWLILNGIILNTRPKKSAQMYARIWTPEGSPLLVFSRRLAAGLESELRRRMAHPPVVALGMRYGEPAARAALESLRERGCRRLLVLPLFPQYSGATVGSTFDAVADVLKSWRAVPELRMVMRYHDEPGYIRALADSVRDHWAAHGEPDRLLISFHGLPQRYARAGDPYPEECRETARLLIQELGLAAGKWQLSFQSRFGREPWLEPYTDATLAALGASGVRRVDVICPGFATDCLETLEEIGVTNRDVFLAAGGREYHYIPALNDHPRHIVALADIIERSMQGWLGPGNIFQEYKN